MNDAFFNAAKAMFIFDEGIRKFPYRCTEGKLTIGIGHNLDAKGVSDRVIDQMLEEDVTEAAVSARRIFGADFLEGLTDNQKLGIINMIFQLGEAGFLRFQRLIIAIRSRHWHDAEDEIKDSKYYKQTPSRAERVIEMITKDKFSY